MNKKIICLGLTILLSGCVTWYKPGATKQDFEVDKANCIYQSSMNVPPAVRQVQIAPARRNPTYTNCNGNSSGNYTSYDCTSTGGDYVPPVNINVDYNQGARNAAFQSCMFSNGWSTQKP